MGDVVVMVVVVSVCVCVVGVVSVCRSEDNVECLPQMSLTEPEAHQFD